MGEMVEVWHYRNKENGFEQHGAKVTLKHNGKDMILTKENPNGTFRLEELMTGYGGDYTEQEFEYVYK